MNAPDDLRIGDAEREEMLLALREHFAQGRLTQAELEERLGLTLNARTGRELAEVGADLPDTRAGRRSRQRGGPPSPKSHHPMHATHPMHAMHAMHAMHKEQWKAHRRERRRHSPVAPFVLLFFVAFLIARGNVAPLLVPLAIFVLVGMGRCHRRSHHQM